MKKLFIAVLGLVTMTVAAQAQKKTSGAIQFETTMDPAATMAANGMPISEEMRARMPKSVKANFELLFTATNASYMPVVENEDSNGGGGGGMGRMMMRFGGGAAGAREYYYSFADQKLSEVFDVSDTSYVMQGKLAVANPPQMPNFGGQRQGGNNGNANAAAPAQSAVQFAPGPPTLEVVKTDETKKILGFNCKKAIVKSIRKATVLGMEKDVTDETAVWYTNDLGFNFSPNPNMWVDGTVLALENKGTSTVATSIEYRGVSAKDVTAPKKALPITQEEYVKKMENMANRMRGQGNRQGGGMGQARSIIIN